MRCHLNVYLFSIHRLEIAVFTWAVWLHSCSDVLLVSHLTTDARSYAISVELPVKLYGNGEYSE